MRIRTNISFVSSDTAGTSYPASEHFLVVLEVARVSRFILALVTAFCECLRAWLRSYVVSTYSFFFSVLLLLYVWVQLRAAFPFFFVFSSSFT